MGPLAKTSAALSKVAIKVIEVDEEDTSGFADEELGGWMKGACFWESPFD